MRANVHDQPVTFRLSGALAAKAGEKAKQEGMSLSELLRALVRREVLG